MKNALLIFHREVRDQLRDRRTLFMIVVLPVLLYPALLIGTVQMTFWFPESARNVVVLGADDLPEPALIVDGRFSEDFFLLPEQAMKLNVISDGDTATGDDPQAKQMLAAAREIQATLQERDAALMEAAKARESGNSELAAQLETKEHALTESVGFELAAHNIQVLMLVPSGLDESISTFNAKLAAGEDVTGLAQPRPQVIRNSADEKSLVSAGRVEEALRNWEREILRRRLNEAHLPQDLMTPIDVQTIDTAPPEAIAASVWSKVFPVLLIVMAMTGAFYPAVDVCAGEKERGTMETVLICPAARHEIVAGKFLTVLLFSYSTALMNLASMAFSGQYAMNSLARDNAAALGGFEFPPLSSLWWLFVLLVPLAALFSALSLALAMFAKSTKEGQYYLAPLMIVVLGMTLFCLKPGTEIEPITSLFPVIGPTLLLKGLLANPFGHEQLLYVVPVIVSSFGYSFLALYWAVEQFKSEDVIFRGAEQFNLGLWLRSLLVDRDRTPTFAEAAACFVTMLFLQFATMNLLQSFMPAPPTDLNDAERVAHFNQVMATLVVIQQVALIALPPIFFGMLLTRSLRDTFRIRLPATKWILAGLVLPFVFHAPTVWLVGMLEQFFPKMPEEYAEIFSKLSDDSIPTWKVLIGIALLPAICEEIAFRGFLLSGFSSRGRIWVGIVFSAICFGAIHMIPIQVFYATALGVVLGLLAVRSGSLLPPILFHLINNSLSALQKRVSFDASDPTGGWLFSISREDGDVFGSFEYGPVWIGVCAIAALSAVIWLVRYRSEVSVERRRSDADALQRRPVDEGDFAGSEREDSEVGRTNSTATTA